MDIGVLIIIAVIVFWQSGAFGSARERNKKRLYQSERIHSNALRGTLPTKWAASALCRRTD